MSCNKVMTQWMRFQKQWHTHTRQDRAWMITMLVIALIVTIGAIFPPDIPKIAYLNTTKSAPIGIYLKTSDQELKKDDFVVLETKDRLDIFPIEKKPAYLLKHIVAMPGERYKVTETGLVTETVVLPRTESPSGISLPRLPIGVFQLAIDEYLVANHPTKSYDSRYFGAVPRRELQKVIPLVTIPEEWW